MQINVIASGSAGNCFIISDLKTQIMLDCGIQVKKIQKQICFGISDVNACLVSHSHSDHSIGLRDLMSKYGIDCYMHKETACSLNLKGCFVHTISHKQALKIGTFNIVPFDVPHINSDGTECANLGYLIYSTETKEYLLFATDFMYIKHKFPACDYYLMEVNYSEEVEKNETISSVEKRRYFSHCSLKTALKFYENQDLSKCKKIYCIHLSKKMCNAQEIYEKLTKLTKKEIKIC